MTSSYVYSICAQDFLAGSVDEGVVGLRFFLYQPSGVVKRDLLCVKIDLVFVKRDLVFVKRDLLVICAWCACVHVCSSVCGVRVCMCSLHRCSLMCVRACVKMSNNPPTPPPFLPPPPQQTGSK